MSETPPPTPRPPRRRKLLLAVAASLGTTVAMRRRGYRVGPHTIVRCRKGHLFTTIWLPLASAKSIRLGFWRFQRCPIGPHWTLVHPVKESTLNDDERMQAEAHRDIRIP